MIKKKESTEWQITLQQSKQWVIRRTERGRRNLFNVYDQTDNVSVGQYVSLIQRRAVVPFSTFSWRQKLFIINEIILTGQNCEDCPNFRLFVWSEKIQSAVQRNKTENLLNPQRLQQLEDLSDLHSCWWRNSFQNRCELFSVVQKNSSSNKLLQVLSLSINLTIVLHDYLFIRLCDEHLSYRLIQQQFKTKHFIFYHETQRTAVNL